MLDSSITTILWTVALSLTPLTLLSSAEAASTLATTHDYAEIQLEDRADASPAKELHDPWTEGPLPTRSPHGWRPHSPPHPSPAHRPSTSAPVDREASRELCL